MSAGRRAYVDKLLIEGKGGVHHIWACDHYKTTLNAIEFKRVYKKRTDLVKDAMSSVPAGDRAAMVEAIMGAIRQGGLFAVDVDIVPTQIGEACHVWLPAATSGEMNLTSMNGERRMRLTERYMDPPGQAMPDCLIAARIANHMEAAFRAAGRRRHTPTSSRASTGRPRKTPSWTATTPTRRAGSSSPTSACAPWAPTASRSRPRPSRTARSSAPSASTPTASSARTARPSSWRPSGAASRRRASRSRRTSSPT